MFGFTRKRLTGIPAALALAFALVLMLATGASAIAPIDYPDFSNTTGLNLVGSAAQAGGTRLRVVPSTGGVGAAWTADKQSVQCGFDTTFTFQITGQTGGGADGLAFAIQNDGSAAIGFSGGGIGYYNIPNSLAVEFDTWDNGSSDGPDGNHISIRSEGTNPNRSFGAPSLGTVSSGLPPFSSDRAVHTAKVTYTPGTMNVYLDDLATPKLTVAVDLATLLSLDSGRAWVGFTAATGAATENEDILSWSYSGNCPPVVTTDATSVTVDEGQTATNSGTVSDSDGDTVGLTASEGTVTNNNDGSWSWSFSTSDGPTENQTVTIYADDGYGGTDDVSFALTVDNVPPTVNAGADLTVNRNDPVSLLGSFTDPAGTADELYPWSWDTTPTTSGAANYGATLPASTSFATEGDYTLTLQVTDKDGDSGSDSVLITVLNQPPVCDAVAPSIDQLWPVDHSLAAVDILGVTDPDGDAVTITVDSIFQDEPTNGLGDGDTSPDGFGVGTTTAEVRAERAGTENGRVYHISFTADDGHGGTCSSEVLVSVPKSQGIKGAAVDDGAVYDSTLP